MGYYKNIHRYICITLIQIIENRIALIKYIYIYTNEQQKAGNNRTRQKW